MIKDTIANIDFYTCISESLSRGLHYLKTVDSRSFRTEEVKLDGEGLVSLHQAYTTEPAEGRLFENHTRHIDIQFVLSGEETIRVTDVRTLRTAVEYSPENDVTLHELTEGTDVRLSAGEFVILFPHDAHIPKLRSGSAADVKKVVVKIPIWPTEAA